MVTASGRPSGIATTRTVIARTRYLTSSIGCSELLHDTYPLAISMIKRKYTIHSTMIAAMSPILPMSAASFSNFYYNGVASLSYST